MTLDENRDALLEQITEALLWAEKQNIPHGGLKFRLIDDEGAEFGHVLGAGHMLNIVVNGLRIADAFCDETQQVEALDFDNLAKLQWETY